MNINTLFFDDEDTAKDIIRQAFEFLFDEDWTKDEVEEFCLNTLDRLYV